MTAVQKPMSNIQLELLKVFASNISDDEVLEIKDMLAQYFAKKSIEAANKAWVEKGLSNDIMDEWLNEENQ
jgi:predicted metal-binding transcription factor (methanogenesis marker protein 9)